MTEAPEEDKLLNLLVTLIETFEEKTYPLDISQTAALALRAPLSEHDLKQTGLLFRLASQGVVS